MFELHLLVPEAAVESVSDALDALDALSVSVEDADAQTPAEQALFGEPGMPPPKEGWQRSSVKALFATEAAAREAAGLLAAQDFFADCQLLQVQAVAEQDWVRSEIPAIMAGVADLKVPLLAEIGFGPNWEKAH